MAPESKANELEAVLADRAFLRRLARGLVADEHRAEDVVQDACVRALEDPPREPGAARRWLARVVRNLALNQRMRELARPAVERRAALPEASPAEEERDFELQATVLEAVRALRQPYRTAIHLRYWRGLSPRAIARELDVPEATVKTRLRRGLELLRADLDRRQGGDRAHWCAGLVALALPELVHGAGGLTAASLAQGIAKLTKGILVMNKPLTASLAAVSLIALATVTWYAADGGGTRPAGPAPSALAPGSGARQADDEAAQPSPEVRADTGEPGAARSALVAEAPLPAAADRAAEGRVVGRVIDEDDRPVAGAEVRGDGLDLVLFPPATDGLREAEAPAPVATAADGTFSLPVAVDGPLTLRVSASGYAPLRKEVTGYYDLETDSGDLVLRRGVTLAGRVVDIGGAPVAGAAIEVPAVVPAGGSMILSAGARTGRTAATTDAAGRFTVDRHAVGKWNLVARSDEHPEAAASGETSRAGERVEDVLIVLPQGATISGTLTGMPAGAPPAGLEVRAALSEPAEEESAPLGFTFFGEGVAADRSALVGRDGSFVLRGLEPGRAYRLGAYERTDRPEATLYSRIMEVPAGSAGVELPWSAGASLLVRVVDASTSLPVEDFGVHAELSTPFPFLGGGPRLLHHPGGLARLDGLRVGEKRESATATVSIVAPGHVPWSGEVVLRRDRELDLGTVRLEPAPLVRVRVVDPAGRPIAGARVRLDDEAASGGPFSGAGPAMRGTVRAAGGGRPGAARAGSLDEGRTGENGEALLSGIPGARALLSVEAQRFALSQEALVLPASGAVEREVVLARGAVVEVLAAGADGRPLAGARVQHRPIAARGGFESSSTFSFTSASRVTDAEGRVYFRNLAAGRHGFRLDDGKGASFISSGGAGRATRIQVAAGGTAAASFTELELAEGETRTLALSAAESAAVYGSVSEAGAPLAGAELRLAAEGSLSFPGFSGGGPSATSDRRGRFSFEEIEPGEYELVVTHPTRAMPHREKLTVRPGGERVELALDVTILEGRVTDQEGRPIAGARVSAERVRGAGRGEGSARVVVLASGQSGGGIVISGSDAAEAVETDAGGRYALRGLSSGVSIRVRAEAGGYAPARSDVLELAPSEARRGLDLELQAGGSLAVEVFQGGAAPQTPVLLRLAYLDGGETGGPPPPRTTDPDGRATFGELHPGHWSVTAAPIGRSADRQPPQEVLIVEGEESHLRIDLP